MNNSSPLHDAVKAGNIEDIYILLSQKPLDINLQNKLGETALHIAAWE